MLCETFRVAHCQYCIHTHSHYVIYAVETDTIPDTSTINPNSDTAYIAIAASAAGRTDRFTEVMGDGRSGMFPVPGDSDVEFNNRALRGGRSYYFFVRLFSSVVSSGLLVCV